MLDTRRHLKRMFTKHFHITPTSAVMKFIFSLVIALVIVYVPYYNGLTSEAHYMFFILIFSASLWISEAIPAFAVAFLLIALEIFLLGFENFDFAHNAKAWTKFLEPWSSPLIFLFLAGFILAIATSKTKLDFYLAKKVIFIFGNKPANILSGLMIVTFVLSMFISNTATTAMMMTMLLPIIKNMDKDNPFSKGLILGVIVAANIGGMGTIIGTPPNAIAVGALGENAPSFIGWMAYALPPSIIIVVILRLVILKVYKSTEEIIDISNIKKVSHFDDSTTDFSTVPPTIPSWKKMLVIVTFLATILLWITGPFHHMPTTVISFLPIVIFSVFGIIDVEDIQEIRWDVIILIVGGLSLGFGVVQTGLDKWIGTAISLEGFSPLGIALAFSFLVVLASNFMSHTAATNIMMPITLALITVFSNEITVYIVVSIALCASCAMILPISTPPNAIGYSTGKLNSKDFLLVGFISALIGPLCIVAYTSLIS